MGIAGFFPGSRQWEGECDDCSLPCIARINNELQIFHQVLRLLLSMSFLRCFLFIRLPQMLSGVNSAFKRNEYQEYLLGVKAAGA